MATIKLGPIKTCVICNEQFTEFGNNPDPVKKEGQCCDTCNALHVIPARLFGMDATYQVVGPTAIKRERNATNAMRLAKGTLEMVDAENTELRTKLEEVHGKLNAALRRLDAWRDNAFCNFCGRTTDDESAE